MKLFAKIAIAVMFASGGAILDSILVRPAIAKCVQADIGVQYNVSGSRVPARQSNDIKFEGSGRCVGNTNVTTGVQGNVGGTAPVIQRRRVRQRFEGDRRSDRRDRRRRDSDFIRIKVNPQIDVYNPAEKYRRD